MLKLATDSEAHQRTQEVLKGKRRRGRFKSLKNVFFHCWSDLDLSENTKRESNGEYTAETFHLEATRSKGHIRHVFS